MTLATSSAHLTYLWNITTPTFTFKSVSDRA
jgi:hypothetical protein